MKPAAVRIILVICLLILGCFGFLQNIKIQKVAGMGDMRGRVVGARLIMDGKLPYYYNWYPGDTLRYYYGSEIDSPRLAPDVVSSLTAPPAMLRIISPIANEDQYKIDWGSFVLFHLFFLAGLIWTLIKVPRRNWYLSLLLIVPFLISDGWMYHVFTVQYYILFGYMMLIIALLLLAKRQIAAGILFAVLVLFRLNTLVFIVPFLIFAWSYRRFILSAAGGVMLYAAFALVNPFEKSLWQQYFSSLKDHQAMHMKDTLAIAPGRIVTLPLLPTDFEGQDYHRMASEFRKSNIEIFSEASNFKQGYKAIMGHLPPISLLHLCFFGCIGILCTWLYVHRKNKKYAAISEPALVMIGILLYFLSSFFSTISNASYQFPQWLAMATILAIYQVKMPRIALVLFIVGVAANCYMVPDFRGKHLVSEVILLVASFMAIMWPLRQLNQMSVSEVA